MTAQEFREFIAKILLTLSIIGVSIAAAADIKLYPAVIFQQNIFQTEIHGFCFLN